MGSLSICKCRLYEDTPLWSSGQSSWLQIQKSGFDSRLYQIFCEIVGLKRGPPSLMSTIEELLGRNNSDCCLESWAYGIRDPSRWPRDTLYPQKLAVTLPTICGLSVGLVRSRTKSTELVFFVAAYCLFIEPSVSTASQFCETCQNDLHCSYVTDFANWGHLLSTL
jgi:hypothetical protein